MMLPFEAPPRLETFAEAEIARRRRRGDKRGEAAARQRLATLRALHGNTPEVQDQLRRAHALRRAAGDLVGAADVVLCAAELCLRSGDVAGAAARVAEARRVYGGLRDIPGLAMSEMVMGEIHVHRGDLAAALASLELALEGLAKVGAARMMAWTLFQIAEVRSVLKQPGVGAALDAAAGAFVASNEPTMAAFCQLMAQRGRRDQAPQQALEALTALSEESGDEPRAAALMDLQLARWLSDDGRPDAAEERLRSAWTRFRAAGLSAPGLERALAEELGTTIAARRERADANEVETLLARAIDLCIVRRDSEGILRVAERLVDYALAIGDAPLGRRWARRSTQVAVITYLRQRQTNGRR